MTTGDKLVIVIVFSLVLAAAQRSVYLNGVREVIGGWSRPSTALADPGIERETCDGTNKLTVCNNCTHITVCVGSRTPRQCPGTHPYCNSLEGGDGCLAVPDTNFNDCALSQVGLRCTSVGVFPDPWRCDRYHHCMTDSGTSDVYTCPQGYVFNLDTAHCVQRVNGSCSTVVCSRKSVLIPYGDSKQFYAYCDYTADRNNPTILMFKCPIGALFNGVNCEFQCPSEGKFPNSSNPTLYYECYRVGKNRRLASRLIKCSNGSWFNGKTLRCESGVTEANTTIEIQGS
ncbi:uncharacterized protein LOC120417272 [Culex pipiens pallens]|uniref:uncharacterized protein LOC120417272 n=1 Tax=Culex pipiens pallens TaxID=42434 RepID=UPI0019546A4A|nr:uncharacterized protein LOC120417272 [Culex pipiens pallens]